MNESARVDIQALRGLAVLLVVLHHADLGPFQTGYLGVDVFFVISGFLITRMIATGIAEGRFSITTFYFRRAKRLLPAAYATFASVSLLAPFVLGPNDLKDYAVQLLGAVTFTGNVALLMQSDYFASESQLKPLLHVWSLAIEEQYYLLLPAAMTLLPRRRWLAGAALVTAASLALCMVAIVYKPVAAFYLLPTRAWELGIGSLAALLPVGRQTIRRARHLYWPAIVTLLALPMLPPWAPHPGPAAVLTCLATVLIILDGRASRTRMPVVAALARVGDFSYSLYLVHWPVLVMLNHAHVEPTVGLRATATVFSLLASYALYRGVELPIRAAQIQPSLPNLVGTLATSFGLVAATSLSASTAVTEASTAIARRANVGLHSNCSFSGPFIGLAVCRTSINPRLMVWGDSYGMHIVPGLAVSYENGLIQATRSVCGPLIDMASWTSDDEYNREWAERCLEFNDSVLEYLSRDRSIDTVALSSSFGHYLYEKWNRKTYFVLKRENGSWTASIRMAGKTTIILAGWLGMNVVV